MTDQDTMTRAFVAEHLRTAHKQQPSASYGCLVCTAWRWSRELRSLDDASAKKVVDSVEAPFGVWSTGGPNEPSD